MNFPLAPRFYFTILKLWIVFNQIFAKIIILFSICNWFKFIIQIIFVVRLFTKIKGVWIFKKVFILIVIISNGHFQFFAYVIRKIITNTELMTYMPSKAHIISFLLLRIIILLHNQPTHTQRVKQEPNDLSRKRPSHMFW